jgi:hypothetical protein
MQATKAVSTGVADDMPQLGMTTDLLSVIDSKGSEQGNGNSKKRSAPLFK